MVDVVQKGLDSPPHEGLRTPCTSREEFQRSEATKAPGVSPISVVPSPEVTDAVLKQFEARVGSGSATLRLDVSDREAPWGGEVSQRVFVPSMSPRLTETSSWFSRITSRLVAATSQAISSPSQTSFWQDAGSALQRAGQWVVDKATDPDTWVAAGKLTLSVVTAGPRLVAHIITHPIESLKVAGGFLKSMCDSTGLTDVAVGIGRCFSGDFRGGIQQALRGAGRFFGEATGLADVWGTLKHGGLALYCLAKGDFKGALSHLGQAAMHGVFAALSIGAIAATVATGGAAAGAIVGVMALRMGVKAAAKQVLKTACKEFLKEAGEKLGQQLVKEVGGVLTREVLQESGEKLAKSGLGDLASKVLGPDAAKQLLNSATTPEVRQQLLTTLVEKVGSKEVSQAFKGAARQIGDDLMKRAGVTDKVASLTENLIKQRSKQSTKEIASELMESGLAGSKDEAMSLAKDIKKVVRGAGRKSDAELKQALEQGIMKPLREHVEAGVREGYERQMKQLLAGLPKNQADEFMAAGWKGAREGLEEGLEKAVREGVERGVRATRRSRLPYLSVPDTENTERPTQKLSESTEPLHLGLAPNLSSQISGEVPGPEFASGTNALPRIVRVTQRDGKLVKETFVVIGSEQRLEGREDLSDVPSTKAG